MKVFGILGAIFFAAAVAVGLVSETIFVTIAGAVLGLIAIFAGLLVIKKKQLVSSPASFTGEDFLSVEVQNEKD